MSTESRNPTQVQISTNETFRVLGFNNGDPKEQREYSRGGIKFFYPKPDFHPQFISYEQISADYLRDEKHVWMPEETLEAAHILFTHGKINVIGEPQMGKGTILFGLSEIFEALGKPYVFFDGHYQDTQGNLVGGAIERANREGIPILYDAFDHNFAGSRSGIRTIPIAQQTERTPKIINALAVTTVPVATTSHDGVWAKLFLNLPLREQFRGQLDAYQNYTIPLNLRSEKSIHRFLTDHNYSPDDAQFLIDAKSNPDVVNTMVKTLGDNEKVKRVFEALRKYPVLKDLVRPQEDDGRVEEFLPILKVIKAFSANPELLESKTNSNYFTQSVSMFSRIILECDYKRAFLAYVRKIK